MRVALICHAEAAIHREGIARWLASWATLAGVVVIREPRRMAWRRLRRERRRVGTLRMLDVLAFRLHYRLLHAGADAEWLERRNRELAGRFPAVPPSSGAIEVASPNGAESEEFLRRARPDLVVALCKTILAERIFTIPPAGTFVFHPGICPEYRNAHGCFWALARRDLSRVGLSLVRIDRGIDTGPVFGHFQPSVDEVSDSHVRIQHQVLLDSLDALRDRLLDVAGGRAVPVDVSGRESREWGQPWLTAYWRWKQQARRADARHRP